MLQRQCEEEYENDVYSREEENGFINFILHSPEVSIKLRMQKLHCVLRK